LPSCISYLSLLVTTIIFLQKYSHKPLHSETSLDVILSSEMFQCGKFFCFVLHFTRYDPKWDGILEDMIYWLFWVLTHLGATFRNGMRFQKIGSEILLLVIWM
jgi:hypothetical protein